MSDAMRVLRSFGFCVSTIVMHLGIPLLGWGLGDLRGYFANGRRLGCALIVLALGFVPAPAVNPWIGLVGSVAFIPIILFRIRDEEALMMDAFGAEGEASSEQPRRLIPFVY